MLGDMLCNISLDNLLVYTSEECQWCVGCMLGDILCNISLDNLLVSTSKECQWCVG